MILSTLAFLLGIVAVQQLPTLPGSVALACLSAFAVLLAYRRYWLPLFLLLGILWASLFALWRLSDRLADDYQNREVEIQGYIASLPQQQEQHISFDFVVTQPASHFPSKIRLNWYTPQQSIAAGQSWRMTVKLKPPHGLLNPGGFDYEAWLFANRIGATGYVREKPAPTPIDQTTGIPQHFAQWRQAIASRLNEALPGANQLGIIKALTIGSQNGISQQQWDVFRKTGTIHLIVISGSHISLIAGLIYLLLRKLWATLAILSLSPQRVAAISAWLAALFYAGLAGYSIPTQRAIVMLTVGLAAIVWQRHISALQILLLALLAVLLFDPLAVLSVGFWLSFGAVALLLYISVGRLGRSNYWRETARMHWATAAGLSPLLILFFQQVSLISPFANALAVPVIGLLVVPLALLAILLLIPAPSLAAMLLRLADQLLQGLWRLLEAMADLPLATVTTTQPPFYAILLAIVAIALMLAPKGLPGRHLAVFLLLPLIFVDIDKPKSGEAWLTLLDVGQGMSAVIQTEHHSLIFDTGAKFSEQFDMGNSVILPFLRHQAIRSVDTLLISHGDNDHSGGAASLLAELPINNLISSAPQWAERANGQYCKAGQNWQWDRVQFTLLSPPVSRFANPNDNACVLRVSTGQHSFLLTGDIEQSAETWLVVEYREQLNSTVLVAPHHGSKTSSNADFLRQVDPRLILISAGYRNRFGFPDHRVLSRYRQLDLPWLNTAEQGAISLRSNAEQLETTSKRIESKRYWMRTVEPEPSP